MAVDDDPQKPWYKKWWIWVIVGVASAIISVLAWLLIKKFRKRRAAAATAAKTLAPAPVAAPTPVSTPAVAAPTPVTAPAPTRPTLQRWNIKTEDSSSPSDIAAEFTFSDKTVFKITEAEKKCAQLEIAEEKDIDISEYVKDQWRADCRAADDKYKSARGKTGWKQVIMNPWWSGRADQSSEFAKRLRDRADETMHKILENERDDDVTCALGELATERGFKKKWDVPEDTAKKWMKRCTAGAEPRYPHMAIYPYYFRFDVPGQGHPSERLGTDRWQELKKRLATLDTEPKNFEKNFSYDKLNKAKLAYRNQIREMVEAQLDPPPPGSAPPDPERDNYGDLYDRYQCYGDETMGHQPGWKFNDIACAIGLEGKPQPYMVEFDYEYNNTNSTNTNNNDTQTSKLVWQCNDVIERYGADRWRTIQIELGKLNPNDVADVYLTPWCGDDAG